jgi:TPR repeat protein
MAMCEVGSRYLSGIGVEPNRAEAIRWLSRAADKGSSIAKKLLSKLDD